MSSDGATIAFTHTYKSSPSVRALYVGHLNLIGDSTDAPDINWIRISPPEMPRDDSEAELLVTVQVDDSAGLETIVDIGRAVLDDGAEFETSAPVSLSPPFDGGNDPDEVAGDGIYTFTCTPASGLASFTGNEVTIRVGIEDADGNAAVADVVLPITP